MEKQPPLFADDMLPERVDLHVHKQCDGRCGGQNRCDDFVYKNGYCRDPKARDSWPKT